MTFEEWALAACVVYSGLSSGLLAMLTLVMHPMLMAMTGRDFARFLRAFLPVHGTGGSTTSRYSG
jgi:hypothetical protein